MRVTMTGATGLIGTKLVRALAARGDEVTVLSRSPDKAAAALPGAIAVGWAEPTSTGRADEALDGRDAVVHLAGEPVAQRWSGEVKRRIHESREAGTRNLRRRRARRVHPARGARRLVGGRLLRAARRRAAGRVHPARRRLPRRGVRGVGARGERPSTAASCACARASCSMRTAARWPRCSRSSRPASAARWPAGGSTCPGSPSTTSSPCTSPRSMATPGRARSTARHPSPSPTSEFSKTLGKVLRRPAFAPVPEARHQGPLRRDGPDRRQRPARGARRGRSSSATRSATPSSSPRCRSALAKE